MLKMIEFSEKILIQAGLKTIPGRTETYSG